MNPTDASLYENMHKDIWRLGSLLKEEGGGGKQARSHTQSKYWTDTAETLTLTSARQETHADFLRGHIHYGATPADYIFIVSARTSRSTTTLTWNNIHYHLWVGSEVKLISHIPFSAFISIFNHQSRFFSTHLIYSLPVLRPPALSPSIPFLKFISLAP